MAKFDGLKSGGLDDLPLNGTMVAVDGRICHKAENFDENKLRQQRVVHPYASRRLIGIP